MYPVAKKVTDFFKVSKIDKQKKRIFEIANTLQKNTQLAKTKYEELIEVRESVRKYLVCLETENFKKEIEVIDNLDKITDKQKKELKKHLSECKERGITELTPLIENSQLLQANLLVTLNKVQIQRAIITSKGKLLSNATLQLDVINLMEDESRRINKELKKALTDLLVANNSASDLVEDHKETVKNNANVIDVIDGKFVDL